MIHVVLPVHDRCATTARFAQRLAAQTRRDFRLLLVDDGCTDGTVPAVGSIIDPARLAVLRGDGNLWWAGALQIAYERLMAEPLDDGEAVLLINDDVDFEPDFLERAGEALASRPGACIQAIGTDPVTGFVDVGVRANRYLLTFRAARPGETPNCLATRGLLMSLRTLRRSGGFRPARLPHYLSDYEFAMRLHQRGVPLCVDERFRLLIDSGSTGIEKRPAGIANLWTASFSNRAKYNPRHWSAFARMVAPWWLVPVHLARIWARFGLALLQAAWHRDDASVEHRSPLAP